MNMCGLLLLPSLSSPGGVGAPVLPHRRRLRRVVGLRRRVAPLVAVHVHLVGQEVGHGEEHGNDCKSGKVDASTRAELKGCGGWWLDTIFPLGGG